jgi:UDP-N-acetylglucosamine diphosphorylase/glucosamine-1-phosphate N-acetyltransferase
MGDVRTILDLAVVILAAGKGTRMKSDMPKVLHFLGGKPLLSYSVRLSRDLNAQRTIVVVGHQAQKIKQVFSNHPDLRYVIQEPQLGTGHAVMTAAPELTDWQGPVLILCGDVPGLKAATCRKLLQRHLNNGEALTVLGMDLAEPGAYGRLVLDRNDQLTRIVEYRDAGPEERAITLVNAGIYAGQAQAILKYLPLLAADNNQKEYYFTDLVELMHKAGLKVGYSICSDPLEVAGVNTVEELSALEQKLFKN